MKWLAWSVAVLVGLIALIGAVGMLLPVRHVAAVRVHVRQSPERVFDVVSDVAGAAEWRTDVEKIELTLEAYARELSRHFGETAEPVRMARESS